MTASAFADRSPADQYLVQRISARDGVDATLLAALPPHELDRLLPGARTAFEHREQVAHAVLTHRGIDPTTPEYQAADTLARAILARVDHPGSDHAA
ncbi:hypothetical protein [Umezawaea sp.]|uniref:hypothetical protein n=1 Tax=Umezawaea sp. TaxID=1955258 RepID=UPI002ED5ECD7